MEFASVITHHHVVLFGFASAGGQVMPKGQAGCEPIRGYRDWRFQMVAFLGTVRKKEKLTFLKPQFDVSSETKQKLQHLHTFTADWVTWCRSTPPKTIKGTFDYSCKLVVGLGRRDRWSGLVGQLGLPRRTETISWNNHDSILPLESSSLKQPVKTADKHFYSWNYFAHSEVICLGIRKIVLAVKMLTRPFQMVLQFWNFATPALFEWVERFHQHSAKLQVCVTDQWRSLLYTFCWSGAG